MSNLAWDSPEADVIGDVRRGYIAAVGAENIRSTQSWGPGAIWFREDGHSIDIEDGLRRYEP